MAEQSHSTSIDGLIKDMQNSEEAYIRKAAAEQLGKLSIKDEPVLNALKNTAESDTNTYVRYAARNSLEKLGDGAKIAPGKLGEKLEVVEKPLTNWQAVGIGALVSFIPILLVAVPLGIDFWGKMDIANILILFSIVTFAGGITGAVISNTGRKNTVWIGAALGSTIGGSIGFYMIFMSGVFS